MEKTEDEEGVTRTWYDIDTPPIMYWQMDVQINQANLLNMVFPPPPN